MDSTKPTNVNYRECWMKWAFAAVVIYALCTLIAYRATPLGQVALLDAREQQIMARQMADGTLPATPYYRAPLWAGVLSVFYRLGMNDDQVLLAGQLLNVCFHLLSVLAIYGAAYLMWRQRAGAAFAALLYGIYPVALYFTGDLLDTTLAQALLCGGLYYFARFMSLRHRKGDGILTGLLLALALLARPQLGIIGCSTIAIIFAVGLWRKRFRRLGVEALLAFVAVLMSFGLIEWVRTGEFYLLPTQGSYNLWSANRPDANGEYYSQQVEIADLPEGVNPAKAEAELLYRKATGETGNLSQQKVDLYWREQFFTYVKKHPAEFAGLYGRKLYAFLHNHEAYNNKTYAVQKKENPFLRWNPVSFIAVSLLGLFALLFFKPHPRPLTFLFALARIYWLVGAFFYTSDRFRLPLIPFILIVAAGAPGAFAQVVKQLRAQNIPPETRRKRWLVVAGKLTFLVGWGLLFTLPLFGVGRSDTSAADYKLMSDAALKVGDDKLAGQMAQRVIEKNPNQEGARENLLEAGYNNLLKQGEAPTPELCRNWLKEGQKIKNPSDEILYIMGLCEWQLEGRRDEWAGLVLRGSHPQAINALAALMVTGPLTAEQVACFEAWKKENELPLVLAEAKLGSKAAKEKLRKLLGKKQAETTLSAWQKLFDRAPKKPLN